MSQSRSNQTWIELHGTRGSGAGPTGADAIAPATFTALFEAVRWAPAPADVQPWRLVWTRRGTVEFDAALDLLGLASAAEAEGATALGLLASSPTLRALAGLEPVLSYSHSFDPISAWMPMALRSRTCCWIAGGRTGVDWDRAARELNIPREFRIEGAIAVGRRADRTARTPAEQPAPVGALGGEHCARLAHLH